MFKFFNRNTIGAYAALPLLLILLRLRLVIYPQKGFTATDADLYTPLWNKVFGSLAEGSVASVVLSICITLIVAYMVNAISNSFHFAERQSLLAALYCVLLSSGFVISQGLHPVHIYAICLCLTLISLFHASGTSRPMPSVYNAFFFASVGWLFWGKGVWFVPLLISMLVLLRVSSLRCILAALMGFATPLALCSTWLFMNDHLASTVDVFWNNSTSLVSFFRMGIYTISYSVLYALLILVALLGAMSVLPKLSITESRYTRSLMWVALYSSLLVALPQFSFELMQLVAMSGGVLIAAMMQRIRSNATAEVVTFVILVVTTIIQWIVKGS